MGNPRVLVVDDDPQVRLLASQTLIQGGFSVTETDNGEDALQFLASADYDLILLDVVMPGLDGFATCEQVRRMPARLQIPVMMMTGLNDHGSIQRAYQVGATDLIIKPIIWPILVQRVCSVLRVSAALRELVWYAEFQRVLMDTLPVPVVVSDSQGRLLLRNQAFTDLLHCRCGECLTEPALDMLKQVLNEQILIPPGSDTTFGSAGQRLYPAQIHLANHKPREVVIHQAAFTAPDSGETGTINILLDMTESQQVMRTLRHSQIQLQAVVRSTADGILVVDREGKVLLTNDRFLELWKIPPALKGSDDSVLLQFVLDQLVDPEAFLNEVKRLYSNLDERLDLLYFNDGRVFERQSLPLLQDRQLVGRIWSFRDITRSRQAEEEILFRTHYDALTGLPNRSQLHELLDQAIQRGHRHATKVGLMFLGLDRFNQVNETLGHASGDLLLCKVAERLKTCLCEIDTIAHYNRDEFVLVLSDVAYGRDACAVAEKINGEFTEPFDLDGHSVCISVNIGIALYPEHGQDVTHLLRHADLAMNKAKTVGRNTYQRYEPFMSNQLAQQLALEVDLRLALERDEFIVYYQPILDIVSGQLAGAEALIRWQHPQRGLVPPDEFIPLAEETGLIKEIGDWILERVCQAIQRWQQIGLCVPISVNLSSIQILRGLTVKRVRTLLQRYDLNPAALAFEITESVLLTDSLSIQHWLEAIRALGIRVDIDDFGTGYSSLSYLRRFPVDRIKIDRSFVSNMVNDSGDRALVKAILGMASSLHLKVVAEGVEDVAQLALLNQLGCEYAQGFHFSRPVPDSAFVAFAQQLSANHQPQACNGSAGRYRNPT
jgi:diguanylate cyclase (GGDEF)-like protein